MLKVFADENESYRAARIALCVVVMFIVVASQFGCGDGEFERQQAIAETNERIARACTPYPDEQRIIEWAIGANGERVLYVTVRQPLGRKGNIAQFLVVNESELVP